MTGISIPASVETHSLVPAFGNGSYKGRDHVFFAYLNLQRTVIQDGFKLIRYNVNGESRAQLFNLNNDATEMHDLSGEERYKPKVAFMTSLLGKTMQQLNDPCDLGKPGWGYPEKWTGEDVRNLNP